MSYGTLLQFSAAKEEARLADDNFCGSIVSMLVVWHRGSGIMQIDVVTLSLVNIAVGDCV